MWGGAGLPGGSSCGRRPVSASAGGLQKWGSGGRPAGVPASGGRAGLRVQRAAPWGLRCRRESRADAAEPKLLCHCSPAAVARVTGEFPTLPPRGLPAGRRARGEAGCPSPDTRDRDPPAPEAGHVAAGRTPALLPPRGGRASVPRCVLGSPEVPGSPGRSWGSHRPAGGVPSKGGAVGGQGPGQPPPSGPPAGAARSGAPWGSPSVPGCGLGRAGPPEPRFLSVK